MQRLPQLAELAPKPAGDPHLVLGCLGFEEETSKGKIWAVYLRTHEGFERIEHRLIGEQEETSATLALLMELIERGVQALPGSTLKSMSTASSNHLRAITGLELDITENNFPLCRDLQILRDTLFGIPGSVDKKPKPKPRLNIIVATDASRRANGRSAIGWVSLIPGSAHEPFVSSRRVKSNPINYLETSAVISALRSVSAADLPQNAMIHVMSDSRIALHRVTDMITSPAASERLWNAYGITSAPIVLKLAPRVKLYWVKGHAGNPANEIADTIVRGETLATTNEGVDRLAMQGLHKIVEKKMEQLKELDSQQLLAGATPYNQELYNEDNIYLKAA